MTYETARAFRRGVLVARVGVAKDALANALGSKDLLSGDDHKSLVNAYEILFGIEQRLWSTPAKPKRRSKR